MGEGFLTLKIGTDIKGDAGIELVRLGDEPRLFWHKSNSNDPDRNVWSIFVFWFSTPGARYSVDPATPIARLQSIIDCCPTRRSAEMAAAAGDAGGPSASVGTSGSAHAKALVFPSGIGQFDVLLDCGALMTHRRPCVRACMCAVVVWRPGSLLFLFVQECVRVRSRSCALRCSRGLRSAKESSNIF